MSNKITVCSIVDSANGNNWNIPEDWSAPFAENDELFTSDPVSANYSDLVAQKISNQFEENGSSPKLRLYSQLNPSFLPLHPEWAGFEGSEYECSAVSILANLKNYGVEEKGFSHKEGLNVSCGSLDFEWGAFGSDDFLPPIQSFDIPSLPALNRNEKFEKHGPNTKSSKKRLYSELGSLPASLDSEKLNHSKRIKFDNGNESDNFSSYYEDSSSSSEDTFHDDLKSIWEWAEIENSIPSTHLSNDENTYSTCEMIDQPVEPYETISPNDGDTGVRLKLLNGKLIHHLIPDDATEKLRENLKTAKKIIRFVQDAVPFSTNYLQRSKIFSSNLYDSNSSARLIEQKVERAILTLRKEFSGRNVKSFAESVRNIGSFKTGNCAEMSMMGLLFSHAKNQPRNFIEMFDGGFDEVHKQTPVEIFEIPRPQGDHVFLVLDRDQRYPSSHYWAWGRDAVVCDVWSGAHWPASMVDQHLLDYAGFVYIDRISYPKIRNFDPSRQTLVVRTPASIQ
ncbi:MAG: hypothetical protein WA347_08255 [Rhabdochlamydiaceae bacterium]|jgi:hypothetical protein